MNYKKIFEKIREKIPLENMSDNAIRCAITTIRKKNSGTTLSAAAAIFSEEKKFSIFRYLEPEDKNSLQYYKKESTKNIPLTQKIKKTRKNFINLPSEKEMHFNFNLGKNITTEAIKMAKAYSILYIYENLLRNIIIKILENEYNKDWFKQIENVKSSKITIKELVKGRKQNEINTPWISKRHEGDSDIYYTDLKDLQKIITNKWNLFKFIIKDQQKFNVESEAIYSVRCICNHNNLIDNNDLKRIEVMLNDLINMMKEAKIKI
jgi:hypothetical protein